MVRKLRNKSVQKERKFKNETLKAVRFSSKPLKVAAKLSALHNKRRNSVKTVSSIFKKVPVRGVPSVSTSTQKKIRLREGTTAFCVSDIVKNTSVKQNQQHSAKPSKRKIQKQNQGCDQSVHGPAETIRQRRQSKEFSRKTRSTAQQPGSHTDSSAVLNIHNTTAASGVKATVGSKRKVPLCSKSENTEASCSSHECRTRPCSCPDPGNNTHEICVIKKCELWLQNKAVSPDMDAHKDQETQLKRRLCKRPMNLNNSDADQIKYKEGCLPTQTLCSIVKAPAPCFNIDVRVRGFRPSSAAPSCLVRGYCSHFSCNSVCPTIDWQKSGPLNFGKLLRPYCESCSSESIKRYLDLYFYLELAVTDFSNNAITIIIQRESASRFFGCTVHTFLIDEERRFYIVGLLKDLVKKSNPAPSSHNSGLSISLCVVPVANNALGDVQFHLFGDNLPLFALVNRTC